MVVSSIGVVEDRHGKERAVVDARYINLFMRYRRFRYESLGETLPQLGQGDFMYTMDFKSGYHQVRSELLRPGMLDGSARSSR